MTGAMAGVELATKTCPTCGETKPLSGFARARRNKDGRHSECRPCSTDRTRRNSERRRAEMGEEAWKALQRENVRKSRERTNSRRDRAYARARWRAIAELIEAHRPEFERRLSVALYEAERPIESSPSAARPSVDTTEGDGRG